MFYTIICAFLLIILPVTEAGVGCGRQSSSYTPLGINTRVFNGIEARPYSWPWVISNNWRGGHFLGGSLLRVRDNVEASDIVLTAAHGVGAGKTEDPSNYVNWYGIAGVHKQSDMKYTEKRSVIKAVYPSDYDRFGQNHDIAILKLDKPINFTDYIRPICLPRQGEALPLNKTCVLAGWGGTGSGGANALQQLISPVHSPESCTQYSSAWYPSQKEIKICAGPVGGKASSCPGDSGSPLVCRMDDGNWVEYGLVSYGLGGECGPGKKPTVYTRVSYYVSWIKDSINELTSL